MTSLLADSVRREEGGEARKRGRSSRNSDPPASFAASDGSSLNNDHRSRISPLHEACTDAHTGHKLTLLM